ncbi:MULTISPECIES: helix-turn-helix domain-containing protein [Arthrobacter]|uniref:Helix-turn-helix domain-containing protein n=2 Tax=Arthrobacter TaxID=1663 RepID=A0ABU9KJJ0_9MICC|nr:helix-turn-helix domain-containing protein [Arthrobacter sp. YJM1]MDP5225748.1 helix-turn-helix domain-containing protein [Arthrobacter sp. YJM1]
MLTASTGLQTINVADADSWRRATSQSFVPLDVSSTVRGDFHGSLRGLHVTAPDLSVIDVAASGHAVHRTDRLVAASAEAYFKLGIQMHGTGLLMQDGREAVLRPGDLAIYATDRPYTIAHDGDFRTLILMFPQTALDLPAEALKQITATTIDGTRGLGALVSPFLVQLAAQLESLERPNGIRLIRNALGLVTTLFHEELDQRPATGLDPHQLLLSQVQAYIEDHLGDPELSPGSIAAAHYISTRHLHELFKEIGTTVATSIRQRRLEHCRADLQDPVLASRPVTAIATRWGFLDSAHFSRVFRAAYGQSPSGCRATARGESSPVR